MSNVKWVNESSLCHGCGACDAVCPHDSISMVNSGKNNFPLIDMSCTDCGLCNKVCSGHQTTIDTSIFESKNVYFVYSTNEEIRNKSSSGGFITQYLLDLLDLNKIDGAIVTVSDGTMIGTKATIVHTREEIINSIGSKYYPSSNCSVLKNIDTTKKYAFVGKGCDIESLELMKDISSKIYSAIYVKIGLMCHHTPNSNETKKLLENYGFKVNSKTTIQYRNEGWPGQTIIQNTKKKETIDYKISWGTHLGKEIPFRCQICTQSFAQNADIIVGDAWSKNLNLDNKKNGYSLIIIKDDFLKKTFNSYNYNLCLEKTEKAEISLSQKGLSKKLSMGIIKSIFLSRVDKKYKVTINKSTIKTNIKSYISSIFFLFKYLFKGKNH